MQSNASVKKKNPEEEDPKTKTWLVFNTPRKIKTGAGYLRRETITRSCLIKRSSFPALCFRGVSLCFRGSSFSLQPLHDNYIARVIVVNLTFLSQIMTKKVLQSIILSKTPASLSDTFYLSRLPRLSKENVKTNRNVKDVREILHKSLLCVYLTW